jgi:peptidoglycan/xylan/chitin deacetylase (PgdA/CDA1 family)
VTAVRKQIGGRGAATCLLMVHRVVDRPVRDHDTGWDSFLRLIDELEAGRHPFTTEPAPDRGSGPAIALTFDDGTEDHLAVGETLAARAIGAIFFVSPGLVGESGYLDEAGVQRLTGLGHRVGSHGVRHERLDQLEPGLVDRELVESRARLEDLTAKPVDLYAPVGGAGVPDLAVRLERAGYVGSRSTRWGIHTNPSERWAMPCLPVTELTLRRGWVSEAAAAMRLPARLAVLHAVKEALPGGIRTRVRHALSR